MAWTLVHLFYLLGNIDLREKIDKIKRGVKNTPQSKLKD